MKNWWRLLAAAIVAVGLAAACKSTSNPFNGTWIVPETGREITFESSTWFDTNGDHGSFSFTGSDPTYTLQMTSQSGALSRQATFVDVDTMRFCTLLATGAQVNCSDLVREKVIFKK